MSTTAVQPTSLDEALDAEFGTETAPPDAGQRRDESGRFAAAEPEPEEAPPVETPDAPVAEPPVAAPAPTAQENYELDLVEDDKPTKLNLRDYVTDEAKKAELRKWLQTGRQHETIVDRRIRGMFREAQRDAASQGYNLGFDGTRFTFSPIAPAQTSAPAAETPKQPDANQLRAKLKELRDRVKEGDAVAAAEALDVQQQLHDAEINQLGSKLTEREKREAKDAEDRESTQLADVMAKVITEHKSDFSGLTDAEMQGHVNDAAKLSSTVAEFERRLRATALQYRRLKQSVAQQVAQPKPAAPAPKPKPAAAPALSGRPPASGGKPSTTTKSILDMTDDELKATSLPGFDD